MKRLIASAITFLVLVGVLCIPALFYDVDFESTDMTASEPTTIRAYKADFTVDEDGDLDVVETLTVNFPVSDRHGIFRFFDRVDSTDPDIRRIPEDFEATADGVDTDVKHTVEQGRYDNYRIGDADTTLSTGDHVYVLKYHMDAALTPGGNDVSTDSQFFWSLIPSGWQQDIDKAVLTVHLPAPAEDVQCLVGEGTVDDGADPCDVQGVGTQDLTIKAQGLSPHTPITLIAGQDVAPPEEATLPWAPRFDDVLGTNVSTFGVFALIALLFGGLGLLLNWLAYEREPRFPLMYAPPEGVGPAQAQFILKESVDRRAFVASLMQAAEHGAVDLQRSDIGWTISDKAGPQGWAGLDPITTSIAGLLSGPGSHFFAGKKDVHAGQVLQTQLSSFTAETKTWAIMNGLLSRAGMGGFGGLMVLLGFAATITFTFWRPFHLSVMGLPFAAFTAGAIALLQSGASTKRTPAGRELWSRIGGFKRILSTPSSKDRFDFSGRQELYTSYLPYAVAFDCAKEWAEKYRVEVGSEPPTPSYWYYGAGYNTVGFADSMVADFDSTLSSAISSYEATQSSSSSGGGGGFSGGGGGGGGGGGSW
ncbi:DUF2207 domain-containing protein [Nocardioides humilatus]|uniref:DUF2207 domain-containing protein n=1 Tax=Nocardioides humilatus TaxID=2607660 RepID=A0A5B1LLN0_9ACTN|nr:DUF2207 domain-containing protein [Nocardioides humilatus]KAA1421384.1 DUF2207 domain-containing protein [Nocardioides humilatus]